MGTRKRKLAVVLLLAALALSGTAQALDFVDIDVEDQAFHKVVRFIAEVSQRPILLGENRDGRPLGEDNELRITIKLEAVHWKTALKLAAEKAGARVKQLQDGRWHVFQPPRYTLSLIDADLGVVVAMIARLGDLNVVFPSDLLRGRKVTLRLTDLRWEKVLEVVVKTSGLVLIPVGVEGKRRISHPEKRATETSGKGTAARGGEEASGYSVTAILMRADGGKSGAVINGVFVEEGAVLPLARLGKKPRLGKITSEKFIVLEAGKARVKVGITGAGDK
jgi:hypothetical protein